MALVVLGLVALLPDCASACSCGGMGSEQEQVRGALAGSGAVFAGKVESITKGEPTPRSGMPTNAVSFRVSQVWKGPERETLQVSTPSQGPSCKYPFKEGQDYLVYARGKRMNVNACGETKPLSEASVDLEVMDHGETMGGSGAVLSDTSGGFPPLGVIGMVGERWRWCRWWS
jgi:hypothetical protein